MLDINVILCLRDNFFTFFESSLATFIFSWDNILALFLIQEEHFYNYHTMKHKMLQKYFSIFLLLDQKLNLLIPLYHSLFNIKLYIENNKKSRKNFIFFNLKKTLLEI